MDWDLLLLADWIEQIASCVLVTSSIYWMMMPLADQ
jgi:hypothetical protein